MIALNLQGLQSLVWQRATESDSRYDLIILDAFEGSKIPKAFTSQDFFTDSYKLLSSDGIIAINSIEHTVDMDILFEHIIMLLPDANWVFNEKVL